MHIDPQWNLYLRWIKKWENTPPMALEKPTSRIFSGLKDSCVLWRLWIDAPRFLAAWNSLQNLLSDRTQGYMELIQSMSGTWVAIKTVCTPATIWSSMFLDKYQLPYPNCRQWQLHELPKQMFLQMSSNGFVPKQISKWSNFSSGNFPTTTSYPGHCFCCCGGILSLGMFKGKLFRMVETDWIEPRKKPSDTFHESSSLFNTDPYDGLC